MSFRAVWGGGVWLMVVGCGSAQADWRLVVLAFALVCWGMLGNAKSGELSA